MSYLRQLNYKIIPNESFAVIHNCSGCSSKSRYINTNRFRVNANGNKLDVWLIYQCEKCKHTYNISIYERQKVSKISQTEYQLFIENDMDLAMDFGRSMQFFTRNKLEIESDSISYSFFDEREEELKADIEIMDHSSITLSNPYGLKLRPEKLASDLLKCSRSQIKKMLENQNLIINQSNKSIQIQINKSESLSG